jgi:hypothetical protein
MFNQKEAVYNAVQSVLKDHKVRVSDGQNVATVMTRDMRAQVNAILIAGFKKGEIKLETDFDSESDLKSYVSGLQSNWLRKDKRLNGGESYTPKNPGIRTGSSDPAIREMRKLLESVTNKADRDEIQQAIEDRLGELEGAKKPKVDISVLPQRLHRLAG